MNKQIVGAIVTLVVTVAVKLAEAKLTGGKAK